MFLLSLNLLLSSFMISWEQRWLSPSRWSVVTSGDADPKDRSSCAFSGLLGLQFLQYCMARSSVFLLKRCSMPSFSAVLWATPSRKPPRGSSMVRNTKSGCVVGIYCFWSGYHGPPTGAPTCDMVKMVPLLDLLDLLESSQNIHVCCALSSVDVNCKLIGFTMYGDEWW